MSLPIEVTVKIREDDVSMTESYLEYEAFAISRDDLRLNSLVKSTMEKFKVAPKDPDVIIKIKFTY